MLLPILLPLGLCPRNNYYFPPPIYIPDSKQPLGLKIQLINLLAPELFFFNFSTPCI